MAIDSFFYESANDRNVSRLKELEPASTFGALQVANENGDVQKTFDERFAEICSLYENRGIDIKRQAQNLITDRALMKEYKEALVSPIEQDYRALSQNDPHTESVISAFNEYWDNKVRNFNESAANILSFLPISTLEFPVLVKQWYSNPMNDLIEVRTTKTPLYRRHIRITYIVNNQTGEKLEYPKCMFDGTWEQMYEASRGLPIREEAVMFDQDRLVDYDIISGLTDGNPQFDKIGLDFKIVGIVIGGKTYYLRGNAITIDHSLGESNFVNGKIRTTFDGIQVNDDLKGSVDFEAGTVSIASMRGQIEGVVFSGHLTNEKNMRSISVTENRRIMNFEVPSEGPRLSMPFSIEEIEDANALLDINYYNRMVDEMVKVQEMNESQSVLKFLADEFRKYNGVQTDVLNLESFARTYKVDLNPPRYFAGDPFQYMTNVVQFRLRSVLHRIIDSLKLEGLSFVISGNPMACQMLSKFTEWKIQSGTNMGGITVNHSYGFGTDLGANVRVVASNVMDAYTIDPVESTDINGEKHSQRELVLHLTGYPTDKEHISFEHIKYTSHIFTNQDSAYLSPQAPGGAAKIVMMTSRYTDISVQGIQADIVLCNSDRVYDEPPTRPIFGWPWDNSTVAPRAGL